MKRNDWLVPILGTLGILLVVTALVVMTMYRDNPQ